MIKLIHVSAEAGSVSLFKNANLVLQRKRYGLVGPNGVGKSTLAKIIAGQVAPEMQTSGEVQTTGPVTYLAQREEPPSQSVAEFTADFWSSPAAQNPTLAAWLSQLNSEQSVESLSGGEWMRVRLAKALSAEPTLLILDEPTNDLDRDSRNWFYNFLRGYEESLLLISHDREALDLVDEIFELSNQGVQNYKGNYTHYLETSMAERIRFQQQLDTAKRMANKREAEREEKLQAKEKRDREAKNRAPKLGLPKILLGKRKRAAEVTSGKLAVQEKHFVKEAAEDVRMSWESQKQNPFVRFDFASGKPHSSRVHFETADFNFRFATRQAWLWPTDISATIRGSERWLLSGRNGAGKSTLLKLLLNLQFEDSETATQAQERALLDKPGHHCRHRQQEVSLPAKAHSQTQKWQRDPKQAASPIEGQRKGRLINAAKAIGYLDQRYGSLDPALSLLENLEGRTRFDPVELRNELAFFGLTKEKPNQKTKTLSGGELLRASLAMALLGPQLPEVLILDEPTNNLDLQSVELLEAALARFEGALLVVSHDHKFVENLKITHKLDLSSARTPRKT